MTATVNETTTAAVSAVAVPVLDGVQFQGDVAVRPAADRSASIPVTTRGVAIAEGGRGGNAHVLLPGMGAAPGSVRFDAAESGLVVGTLVVDEGATALLAHPEHGYSAIGPGCYELRRQREQVAQREGSRAGAERFVID